MILQLSIVRVISLLVTFPTVESANGDWKLTYPPWGESTAPTAGAPQIWFPLIGPFTRHSCFPSRYLSMRIAVNHINRRDSTFCPAIGTLQNNFEFTYDIADSNANGIGAASAVLQFLSNTSRKVKVVLGPNSSGSSMSMSNILAVFGIPHISWAATNGLLSNKASYPMFFRVVSPDSLGMKVLAGFMAHLNWMKCNCAYFDADFQSGQANDFLDPARQTYSITVQAFSMPNSGKGGAAVSAANMPSVQSTVAAIRDSGIRIAIGLCINEEAYDFFRTAYDAGIYNAPGWIWLGTDGINGGQLAGDANRLKYFSGSIYIQAFGTGPNFNAYANKWAQLMPTTQRPEFDQFILCVNGSSDNLGICQGNPDFKGWKDNIHALSLVCQGYTGLAYDGAVTLAIVADRLISKGKTPAAATAADWLAEMRTLKDGGFSFECLTGSISFNDKQERDMPFGFYNWHNNSLTSVQVALWDGINGYQWKAGTTITWPSGMTGVISGTPPVPPQFPTGLPPTCAAGKIYNNTLLTCMNCPAGKFNDAANCVDCYTGKYQANAATTECASCQIGKYAGARGMTVCDLCEAGKFQAMSVGKSCDNCNIGYFQMGIGGTACDRCGLGNYSDTPGAQVCKACTMTKTTDFVGSIGIADCGCAQGYYLQQKFAICEPCPIGMECPFGSEEGGFDLLANGAASSSVIIPKVKVDHYSLKTDPLSIYKCARVGICPGNLPESCSHSRLDLNCALCPDGQVTSGKECNECSGLNKILPIFIFIILAPIPVGMYKLGNSPVVVNAPTTLVASLSFGIMLTTAQILGTFSQLSVPWPDKVNDVLETFTFMVGNPKSVTMECVIGQSATANYALRVAAPFAVGILFIIYYFLSQLLAGMKLAWEADKTLNSVGTLVQAVFIAVVGMAALPMQCYSHPNGKSSVVQHPEVLCGEGDHGTLIILAVVLLGFVVCPFIVVSVWAVVMAPNLRYIAQKSWHYVRYRFLLYRFRPDVWWWGLVFLVRQTILGFAPMVSPDDASVQIIYVVTVLVFYLGLQSFFMPWKTLELNTLDGLSMCLLSMVMVTVSSFMPASDWSGGHEVVMWAFLVFVMCLNAFLFTAVILSLCKEGRQGEFGVPYPRNRTVEEFAKEIHTLCQRGAHLQDGEWVEILQDLNTFDRRVLDRTQAFLKLSSNGKLGVDVSKSPARLSAPHSKTSKRNNSKSSLSGGDSKSGESSLRGDADLSAIMDKLDQVVMGLQKHGASTGERLDAIEDKVTKVIDIKENDVPTENTRLAPFMGMDLFQALVSTPRLTTGPANPTTPRNDAISRAHSPRSEPQNQTSRGMQALAF